ncbi:hypothetical protein BH24ACT10_BH24ACT10_06670 [soil metagenome]
MDTEDEARQLDSARRALVAEFSGTVPAEEVERRFAGLVAEFEAAPVRSFVPVLVRRQMRELLRTASV